MTQQFHNYPERRKGPDVPNQFEDISLPVLRGSSLEIGATM